MATSNIPHKQCSRKENCLHLRLWLVRRVGGTPYDAFRGFVIRAADEGAARRIASECNPRFGAPDMDELWLSGEKATCVELSAVGDEDIILSDFRAG